jgi:hypothetical protein
MPSFYDKLMEKSIKESQQPSPLVANTPQEDMTRKPANQQAVLPANPQNSIPEKPHDRKPANPQTRMSVKEQVEKYTTRLEPSLVKRIKIYAAEHDLADYEVVKQAVEEYLAEKK